MQLLSFVICWIFIRTSLAADSPYYYRGKSIYYFLKIYIYFIEGVPRFKNHEKEVHEVYLNDHVSSINFLDTILVICQKSG